MKHQRPHVHPRHYKSGKTRWINPHIKKRVKRNYGSEDPLEDRLQKPVNLNQAKSEFYTPLPTDDTKALILKDIPDENGVFLYRAGKVVPIEMARKAESLTKKYLSYKR